MELVITSRNLELTEEAKEYIEKKFAPISRRLRGVSEAKVEIRGESTRSARHQVVVQVTLSVNGALLRAEERASILNTAIDVVTRALNRQVLRYKGQRFASLRAKKGGRGASIRSVDEVTEGSEAGEERITVPSGKVVRVKRFLMEPLTLDEAATQMEFLGHDFFFFLNAGTKTHNVLYRRRDGDYTVIEPDGL
ncbi:MAG: ribosome-associated translation inhibitor RaiA [Dehalococcoidia bacterium]